jgi:hypothetical protein
VVGGWMCDWYWYAMQTSTVYVTII